MGPSAHLTSSHPSSSPPSTCSFSYVVPACPVGFRRAVVLLRGREVRGPPREGVHTLFQGPKFASAELVFLKKTTNNSRPGSRDEGRHAGAFPGFESVSGLQRGSWAEGRRAGTSGWWGGHVTCLADALALYASRSILASGLNCVHLMCMQDWQPIHAHDSDE